jgi:hypothetical protein
MHGGERQTRDSFQEQVAIVVNRVELERVSLRLRYCDMNRRRVNIMVLTG